ncbi:MAG: hypothetical protein KDK70_33800 [Myxococcales bacterium]|nr:hypothetical protein [Myxococcales bacterium]
MVAAVALGLGGAAACNRHEPSVAPTASGPEDCNAADDCNDFLQGSTIRQHSEQAGSFATLSEGCPYPPDEVPDPKTLVDRRVPEFNAARSRASNMHRGEERLQEIDIHAHMMGMQPQIFACVDLASCYEDGAKLSGWGDLELSFELHPDGHVAAVSVHASPGLDHPSVVACTRQAMYEYRFPSYDGGQMMVEYTVTIEEVPDA